MSASDTLIRLGSRESPLALVQARLVESWLKAHWPALTVELKTFKTLGDQVLDTALSKVGDKGLFVKELEVALLAGEIDLAVHSMKDMPTALPEGLLLHSAGEREDPRDVLIGRHRSVDLAALPAGAVVGTSSLRREAQLRRLRPDLVFQSVRGNLQTRLRKLEEGPYEALVLAAAGVHRLGWQNKISYYFNPVQENIPAVCQGVLGVETRVDDVRTHEYLAPLQHDDVETAMRAERAVLRTLEGGCQVPLGAYACPQPSGGFELRAVVLSPQDSRAVFAERSFVAEEAEQAGEALAQELLANGAREILSAIREQAVPPLSSP